MFDNCAKHYFIVTLQIYTFTCKQLNMYNYLVVFNIKTLANLANIKEIDFYNLYVIE